MPGRKPPSYCTLKLIVILQGHQRSIIDKRHDELGLQLNLLHWVYYEGNVLLLIHAFSVLSLQMEETTVTQQVSHRETYQMTIPLVVTKRYECKTSLHIRWKLSCFFLSKRGTGRRTCFFSFFNLTYSRWTSSLPSCLWSLRIFPSFPGSRLTIFLSRCKFSTLTTRQPMVEFYLLAFPRFPLRKKEHKSYFSKNRTHDFRTSRCAGYLL